MLKWLGRIIFIVVAITLSLQVYYYAQYSKLQKYYNENMIENLDHEDIYLRGVNTLADLEYYQKDPIYEYISTNNDYKFKLAIRAVAAKIYDESNNLITVDGLMLYLNNIDINNVELPIIKMTVSLNQNSIKAEGNDNYTNETSMIYNPNEGFPQSNIPVLFLLNANGSLIINDVTSTINSIKIEYVSSYVNKDDKLVFNDIALFIASTNNIGEAAYVKDNNFYINENDFLLLKNFDNDIPNENDISNYNLVTNKDDLNKYNIIVWKTMIAYILIALLLTYFIFFHKKVYKKFVEKRSASN